MAARRVTFEFSLSSFSSGLIPDLPLDPRKRFWSDLNSTLLRQRDVPPFLRESSNVLDPERSELRLRTSFGERLRQKLLHHFRRSPEDLANELLFRVVEFRYGSALIDLDIFGLGRLAEIVGSNEDFLIALLEQNAPDAFVDAVVGPIGMPAAEIGLHANARVQEASNSRDSAGRRLWNAMNMSLLVPVVLTLLVYYVAFIELHYEKAGYLDQNRVLMEHYESEMKSLDSRMKESTAPTFLGATLPEPSPLRSTLVAPPLRKISFLMIIGDVLILGGVAVLLFQRNRFIRLAAGVALLAGAAAHGYVGIEIKSLEVKIGNLFQFDNKIDIGLGINNLLKDIGPLGPEPLMEVHGFDPGKSSLKPDMNATEKINITCGKWKRHNLSQQQASLIVVVGGTDRVRLAALASSQFESNFGLARARAEEVKSKIVQCGVPDTRVLALVSGPQHTPDIGQQTSSERGYPEDRRVDVWAFWTPVLLRP
jgi:hypothetical protein